MRVVSLFVLATVAACASSGIPESRVSDAPTTVEVPWSFIMEIGENSRTQPTRHALPQTPDELWPSLLQAYGSMQIGISQADTATYVVGNTNMALPDRRLAGERISRSLDCGRTGTGVPVADRYSVMLQIFTQLVPTQEGTEVRSVVTGRATNPTSNDPPVRCVSTGYVEERLANAMLGIS